MLKCGDPLSGFYDCFCCIENCFLDFTEVPEILDEWSETLLTFIIQLHASKNAVFLALPPRTSLGILKRETSQQSLSNGANSLAT